ncbi:hypothetical protein SSX86_015992 [Deinandra increscens subsp. villosa]|uniref:Uncharacterized protein n=1 Tax=Deinandra increscens subsp. villosa TaxID=3103831 RepID=A0AAP0D1U4_9ASTR
MGTEVHYKNLFPGYHSMRNVNEESTSSSWHLFNALTNGHYYDGFTPRTVTDAYFGHDKDELKQKMLLHEAVFKNQVYELHRLYRRQRDIMEEVKRKEFNKYPISIDTSSSSSLMVSQKPYEDANMWHNPSFPMGNSTSRPFIFGAEISNSPLSSKGNGSKDCEVVECRPSKVRKRLFDLQLPGHEYIDQEEGERIVDNQTSKEDGFVTKIGVKTFLDDGGKKDGYKSTAYGQHSMRSNGLADLNEPYGQEASAIPKQFRSLPFEGKSNGRDRFSACLREPGDSVSLNGCNMNYTSQYFETSKLRTPSDSMQHLHSKEFQHRGFYSEISSKIQDDSHFNQTPLLSNASSAYPFASTSDVGNSLASSWVKPADSFTHKLTSFQKNSSFMSSPKSHEVFSNKWHKNSNGSSSGAKELPARMHSVGFGYQKCNKLDDGSQKILKGSNFVDLTGTAKDMDLNTVQKLSNEDGNSRKCDQTVLPWLQSGNLAKEKDDSLGANKKRGFSIFGNFCVLKNDDSSAVSTSASIKHRGIDINVTWDAHIEKQIDAKTDAESKNFKNHFDLNSCVTEDDDLLVMESVKSSKKTTMEIDLEAPAVSEIVEEDEHKETKLEPNDLDSTNLEKIAAKAIIEICSYQNHVESTSKEADDPLLWFVEVIVHHERKLVSATREMDEYEMLTLQLEKTKEEAYMPMPLVPDFQEPDEACPTPTGGRPRRGHARRGRPRRDFQRDVLPGMTSLSRHEITEDLQIFGGLMRATGYSWTLKSTRRNGKRLGAWARRKVKAVETTLATTAPPPPPSPKKVNTVEVVGLDERSLTGWGKTTRRPRRQRCAAGNSVAVQST